MPTPARSSGLFSGLVLISVGILVLLHNYGHLDLHGFFVRWWPLMIIFWGAVKLYERTAGRRFGGSDGGGVTGTEVLLVVGMLALVAIVGWAWITPSRSWEGLPRMLATVSRMTSTLPRRRFRRMRG